MTLEQIQTAVVEIAKWFEDKRTNQFQVEAPSLIGNKCTLSGTVLDKETMKSLIDGLTTRFPGIIFYTDEIRILRQHPPHLLTVNTNLTGLYAKPSFLAEMMSQVLNGWRIERLLEQESWTYIRQSDGYLGWIYRPYLSELPAQRMTHIVCEPIALLYEQPEKMGDLAGRVLGGTAVTRMAVQDEWAQIDMVGGRAGWTPKAGLRSLDALPGDEEDQRDQIIKDGFQYVGVPYLWGGGTALGIDCSGLAQLLYRLARISIPRDADLQHHAGQAVDFPFQPGDLLFFGSDEGHRKISHVAISLGGWRVLHASRVRNGVYPDDLQVNTWLRKNFVGARAYL